MQSVKTLMLREWMQHRQSWLRLGLFSPLICWALLYLFVFKTGVPHADSGNPLHHLAGLGIVSQSTFVVVLSLLGVLFTVPGLPYRDVDDKSLAFWRSLPLNDAVAVATPIVMNALLLPLMAISIAIAMNLLLSAPLWLLDVNFKLLIDLVLSTAGALLNSAFTLLWFLPLVLMLAVGNSLVRRWGLVLVLIVVPMLNRSVVQLFKSDKADYLEANFSAVSDLLWSFDHSAFLKTDVSLAEQYGQMWSYMWQGHAITALVVIALTTAALIWRRQNGQTA